MRIYKAVSYTWLLISGLNLSKRVCAQDLIFNGNFEDINYCKELKQPCSPSAWFYVNNNPLGYHKRKEADHHENYALFFGGFGKNQYWQTILADKLIPGEEYVISFDISTKNPFLDDYGFLFTDNFLFAACDIALDPKNYITMSGGNEKGLKSGWTHVEKRFIADSEFKCLVVGNFGKSSGKQTGFDFDNLRLHPVKHKYHIDSFTKDSFLTITGRHDFHKACHQGGLPDLRYLEKNSHPDSIVIDNLQFSFNSSAILNTEVINRFDSVFFDKNIEKILVFGYSDSVGSEKHNFNLSKKRAEAVRKLLIEKYGFPGEVVVAIGRGVSKEYSVTWRNRRVEIMITWRNK